MHALSASLLRSRSCKAFRIASTPDMSSQRKLRFFEPPVAVGCHRSVTPQPAPSGTPRQLPPESRLQSPFLSQPGAKVDNR